MGTSLGHGLQVLRELAKLATVAMPADAHFRDKVANDLAHEAQKFFVFRTWKIRDRQFLSLQRIRSLIKMLSLI